MVDAISHIKCIFFSMEVNLVDGEEQYLGGGSCMRRAEIRGISGQVSYDGSVLSMKLMPHY